MSDCISRQAAIDALAEYIQNVDKVIGTGHLTEDDCKDAATSVFEELPSVQPERKKGKWKRFLNDIFHCCECGRTFAVIQGEEHMNFCPNCGARMEEIDEADS